MTKNRNLFFYLPLIISLSACIPEADNPKTIADKYWQHMQNGNTDEAKKLISNNSQPLFLEHKKRIDNSTIIKSGEATTIVSTTITTIDADNNSHSETFNTVLVLQQGQWKVDAQQSQIPATPEDKEKQLEQMSEALSESMQKNIKSMDEAVNQGMQILNEALQEGSEEMGGSLLQLMNELNSTMQQSIDKMKQRREQQRQEQHLQKKSPQNEQQNTPGTTQPDPSQGEGMI